MFLFCPLMSQKPPWCVVTRDSEPEPTPEQTTSTSAISDPTASKPEAGLLTGTNGCSVRYSLQGTGEIDGKPYAAIADEGRNQTLDVFVGQEMPFGVTVISIDGLTVKVEDTKGVHVLPFTPADWRSEDFEMNEATDGLISYKLVMEDGVLKRTPVEIKVFEGYSYD